MTTDLKDKRLRRPEDANIARLARQLADKMHEDDSFGLVSQASAGDDASSKSGGSASSKDHSSILYTQQTCHFGSDESELCTFEGPICFDGTDIVVSVPEPTNNGEAIEDGSTNCQDPRYYEPSSMEDGGCTLARAGERSSYDATQPIDPATGYAMSLAYRRWGPYGRAGGMRFREVKPFILAGSANPAALLAAAAEGSITKAKGLKGVTVSAEGPVAHPVSSVGLGPAKDKARLRLSGVTTAAATTAGGEGGEPVTVQWLDHPMWLAGLDGQWKSNPFHWWSKIGAIYDARRSNATPGFLPSGTDAQGRPVWPGGQRGHPDNGYIQHAWNVPHTPSVFAREQEYGNMPQARDAPPKLPWQQSNRLQYKVGPQWELPPLESVIFTGKGAEEIASAEALNDWASSTLQLATMGASPSRQGGTAFTFNNLLSTLSKTNLVCSAKGGVVLGAKNKWFTGRGDAWMWRQYAYQATGLSAKGVRLHPRFPPRQITLVDRVGTNGRGMHDRELLLSLLQATGVPVQVVDDMGSLSFEAQVSLMARTGILVAVHGAALANAMFLPAHAVLVEIFPYGMKKNTYRHLAGMADLTYFPLYSWSTLDPTVEEHRQKYYGVQLMAEEYYWSRCAAVNISSIDALNEHACNAASKNYPVVLGEEEVRGLRGILRDAVDIIAAFSLQNPAWKAIVDAQGLPPLNPRPPYISDTVHGMGADRKK